jgi:hypothetical protein
MLLKSGASEKISAGAYLAGSGGTSTIHGHTLIVLTLVLLFFTTVIFISRSLSGP